MFDLVIISLSYYFLLFPPIVEWLAMDFGFETTYTFYLIAGGDCLFNHELKIPV